MNIGIEFLDYESVFNFFLLTSSDFPDFQDPLFLKERAMKLSKFAEFVTCRTAVGEKVGMIAFYRNNPPLCYISHFSVLESYKGLGLFRQMYFLLEQVVCATGYSLIKLEVSRDNVLAINCYRSCGFEFVDNGLSKSLYMEKLLSSNN